MIIGHGKVSIDLMKVAAIAEWLILKNRKEVQQFLGFTNYYSQFIKGFSGVAKPLTSLIGNKQWHWESEQQNTFEEIKK